MSKNTFKDEMLRHLATVNAELAETTGHVLAGRFDKGAESGANAVFRMGQVVKALDKKTKESK